MVSSVGQSAFCTCQCAAARQSFIAWGDFAPEKSVAGHAALAAGSATVVMTVIAIRKVLVFEWEVIKRGPFPT